MLVDCGLFQGAEISPDGAEAGQLLVTFALAGVPALMVTQVHIDHVCRVPYLMAAGFRGPILCSEASAMLLPLVLEDAIKLMVTKDPQIGTDFLAQLSKQIVPLPGHLPWSGA